MSFERESVGAWRQLLHRISSLVIAAIGATVTLALILAVFILATTAVSAGTPDLPQKLVAPPVPTDPAHGEVPLPAEGGWAASLVLDNRGIGIWGVRVSPFFDEFGCPEIVGVDDRGRCIVLVSYSGKWTPRTTVNDGMWLGGLACADVDPRQPRGEIYCGGLMGNLYQVTSHAQGMMDCRLLAQLPGHEINVILAGDLDPRTPGRELIVFTKPGGMYRLTPDGLHGRFTITHLEDIRGRIRDAVAIPGWPGTAPEIATVARDGRFAVLRITKDGHHWTHESRLGMGRGRLALRPRVGESDPVVLYSTLDDGRVVRHERRGAAWTNAMIYAGPQGLRGIVAGRFHEDPGVECVAVYGYSGKVQMLERANEGWSVRTIFRHAHRGHWLARGELDGRNNTEEIVASGFSGRVVLLSRPEGYGLPGVATDPDDVPAESGDEARPEKPAAEKTPEKAK